MKQIGESTTQYDILKILKHNAITMRTSPMLISMSSTDDDDMQSC